MAKLFCKQAEQYASSRPAYPPELFTFIYSKTPSRRLAWDVATGSGQAAISLSHAFDSVVATDSSPEQLSHAPTHLPNTRFIVTPPSLTIPELHRLVAPPRSVDLITVAQALHWLDLPAFYAQARAVLRPGGVVAAWCYTTAVIAGGDSRVDEIYRGVYGACGPYWAEERRMVEEGYGEVELPFGAVEGVVGTGPVFGFAAEREFRNAGEFLEYVRSWSAYQTAKEKGVEILTDEIVEEFKRAWNGDDEGNNEEEKEINKKNVVFPISLRIGRHNY